MNILVSACLLGCATRYDGASRTAPHICELMNKYTLIPVCPEQLGGLATPRVPAERQGSLVVTRDGVDVTEQYKKGAAETLRLAKLYECTAAILKERSPSCGCGLIYDGSFSGTLTGGNGVTAELLLANNIKVLGESSVSELL